MWETGSRVEFSYFSRLAWLQVIYLMMLGFCSVFRIHASIAPWRKKSEAVACEMAYGIFP